MEIECGNAIGDGEKSGGAMSITSWWVYLDATFLKHVLVSPFEIWEILMGRNRDEPNPKRGLMIGMAGNVGGGPHQ